MRIAMLLILILFTGFKSRAQAVFDVLQMQYQHIPSSELLSEKKDRPVDLKYFQTQLNLPWKWNSKNTIVFNPQYESRTIEFKSRNSAAKQFQSFAFTLSNQYTFRDTTQQIVMAAMLRHNSESGIHVSDETIRPAFAMMYTKRTSNNFAIKLGAYYSKELFGNLWLPLIGVEWRLSKRLWIWGVLPRYAVLDYTVTKHWHSGIVFKGVTDSYRLPEQGWFSIVEAQLRWANDFYIPKTPLMITLDIGHTLSRVMNQYDANTFQEQKINVKDGIIFKAGIAWRVVVDKRFGM